MGWGWQGDVSLSIPGGGSPKGDRSPGWKPLAGEAGGTDVGESAVGTALIVVAAEVLDHYAHLCERPELLAVEVLVAKAAVKRFDEAIFPRAGRVDVGGFNPVGRRPALNLCGDELQAVVLAEIRGCPVFAMARCNQCSTSAARRARSAPRAWHSRVYSSRMVGMRKVPPRTSTSPA